MNMSDYLDLRKIAQRQPLIPFKKVPYGTGKNFGFIFSHDFLEKKYVLCLENMFETRKRTADEFSDEEKIEFNSLEELFTEWRVD